MTVESGSEVLDLFSACDPLSESGTNRRPVKILSFKKDKQKKRS